MVQVADEMDTVVPHQPSRSQPNHQKDSLTDRGGHVDHVQAEVRTTSDHCP
jgi:hypothetical protein